jgi:DNA-binding MarR family transcriptional regulator
MTTKKRFAMVSRFEQLSAAISRIYHNIQKIERTEMEKFGLKGPHVQCLLALSLNPEGLTASQLCAICEKDKAAISRTITELEKVGILNREDHNGNRYRVLLKLTERGKTAAARVDERVRVAMEKAGEGLTEDQRSVFYSVLSLIAGNLQGICADGLEEN